MPDLTTKRKPNEALGMLHTLRLRPRDNSGTLVFLQRHAYNRKIKKAGPSDDAYWGSQQILEMQAGSLSGTISHRQWS